MAQAVSRRSLTTEALFNPRKNPFVISGGQSGKRAGFSPNNYICPCQYHSTIASYSYFIHHRRYMILATDSVVKYHTLKHNLQGVTHLY